MGATATSAAGSATPIRRASPRRPVAFARRGAALPGPGPVAAGAGLRLGLPVGRVVAPAAVDELPQPLAVAVEHHAVAGRERRGGAGAP